MSDLTDLNDWHHAPEAAVSAFRSFTSCFIRFAGLRTVTGYHPSRSGSKNEEQWVVGSSFVAQ